MGEEITTHGYSTLTFAKWTTIIIAEGYGYGMVWIWNGCGYGMVMVMLMEWFWYGYLYGMVFDRDDFGIALESCVIYSHPLCGSHFVVIKLNV
jgi:hypothetical protein